MRVAAGAGLHAVQVPGGQRRRVVGISKVTGNPPAFMAEGWRIAATFLCLALELRRGTAQDASA